MGGALRGRSFALVLSSPLQRARETARLAGFEPELRDDLAEWDYGEYDGVTTPEIREQVPGLDDLAVRGARRRERRGGGGEGRPGADGAARSTATCWSSPTATSCGCSPRAGSSSGPPTGGCSRSTPATLSTPAIERDAGTAVVQARDTVPHAPRSSLAGAPCVAPRRGLSLFEGRSRRVAGACGTATTFSPTRRRRPRTRASPTGPEPLQFGDLRVPRGEGPFPLARRAPRRLLAGDLQRDPHRPPLRSARARPGSRPGTSSTAASACPAASGRRPREDLELALAYLDRLPFDHDGRTVLVGHSAGGQLALWAAKHAQLPVSRSRRSPTSATPSSGAAPGARRAGSWRRSSSPTARRSSCSRSACARS